jgi:DtxR family Mn-dependent transcriptional regulator
MYDYLAAIYRLGAGGQKVTTTALAEQMHVSAAAASSMLKRLEESGLVERPGRQGIMLPEQGLVAALQLIRRHRLLEVFLVEMMGYTWDQVDAEAHRLEHAISADFEKRIDMLCGYPTHCPHGDPIPHSDGTLPDDELLAIPLMRPGQQGVLRRVGTEDASALRYLGRLQLMPGQVVKLISHAPFDGPVTLELPHSSDDGDDEPRTEILGHTLADLLYVDLSVG